MNIEGILFDLDGTLADTLPVCIQAYQETVNHFMHWYPSQEEVTQYFGTSDEGILEKFMPGMLEITLPYYLEVYERLHKHLCADLFPGVDRVLTLLAEKQIRNAIVTGKGRKSADISMKILGLDRWIDIVETGFADRNDKPYCIRKILSQWGMRPERAAYVGDTPYDMAASRQTGLLPLGAAWANTATLMSSNSTSAAYKVFFKIDDLINWIEAC